MNENDNVEFGRLSELKFVLQQGLNGIEYVGKFVKDVIAPKEEPIEDVPEPIRAAAEYYGVNANTYNKIIKASENLEITLMGRNKSTK